MVTPNIPEPRPSLDAELDAAMAELQPVSVAELAEHLRSMIGDWIGPDCESVLQAQAALERFDRQQHLSNPPWLRT